MEVVRSVHRRHERYEKVQKVRAATLFRLSEMQRSTSKAPVPFYRVIYYIIPEPLDNYDQLMAYRDNSTGRASLRGWRRPAIVEIMRSSNKLAFLVPPDYDKSVVASVRPRKVRKRKQRWRTIFKNFKRESMHDVQDVQSKRYNNIHIYTCNIIIIELNVSW